jgi:hypothetical protein
MADTPNAAEPRKPRRRWFQFRLRTLLIGVMLLSVAAAYVRWQAKIVSERTAWLAEHEQYGLIGGHTFTPGFAAGREGEAPSLIRRWLGDKPHRWSIAIVDGAEPSWRTL